MKKKLTLAIASSALVLLATTGCGLLFDQTSIKPYDPSDGFSVTVDDVKVRNAMVVSADGTKAVFVAGIVTSGESKILNLNLKNKADEWSAYQITVSGGKANAGVPQHYEVDIADLGAKPGDLLEATVQYGNSSTVAFYVPVIDAADPTYADLLS